MGEEHVCFHPDCRMHHFGDETSLCWLSSSANEYVLSIPNARYLKGEPQWAFNRFTW